MRTRIKDIAKKANVSVGTVDRVIHNRGQVSATTQEKIMKIIEEIGYEPDIVASSLASKKTYRLSILIPMDNGENEYWNAPLKGFERAFNEIKHFNINIEYFLYNPQEKASFTESKEKLLKSEPDGVVLAPVFHDETFNILKELNKNGIPYIFIDSNLKDTSPLSYIGQDPRQSGFLSAKLLHYGVQGTPSYLVMSIGKKEETIHHSKTRQIGFKDYFDENNLPIKNIIYLTSETNDDREVFYLLEKSFNQYKDIAGIYVTDSKAHKVAKFLENKNLKTRVVGYDLTDKNVSYLKKDLITFLISQRPDEQGYIALMSFFISLFLHKKIEKYILMPIDIITKENVNFYKSGL